MHHATSPNDADELRTVVGIVTTCAAQEVVVMDLHSAASEYATRPPEDRFKSWAAYAAFLHTRRRASTVYAGPQQSLRVVPNGGLTLRLGTNEQPFALTHHAFSQVASIAAAPGDYLRTLPPELAAQCMNHGFKAGKSLYEDGKVRLLVQGQQRLRAVTSTSYGRIWDHDVATAFAGLNDRLEQRLKPAPTWDGNVSLYASDRDSFMLLVDGGSVIEEPSGFGHRPSQLHRGVMVKNSETGYASFEMLLFWFRIVCGNLMIHDGRVFAQVKIRHSRLAPAHLTELDMVAQTRKYLDSSSQQDRVMIERAMQYLLPAPKEERVKWLREKAEFTKGDALETIELAEKEEGDARTLWQVVQGATAIARKKPYVEDQALMSRQAMGLLRLAA